MISPIVTGFGDGMLPGPRPPERGNGRGPECIRPASAFYRLALSLWVGGMSVIVGGAVLSLGYETFRKEIRF